MVRDLGWGWGTDRQVREVGRTLSARQRCLDARMSWKVLKEAYEFISTVFQRLTLIPGRWMVVTGCKETRLRQGTKEELLQVSRKGSRGENRAWSSGMERRVGRTRETA